MPYIVQVGPLTVSRVTSDETDARRALMQEESAQFEFVLYDEWADAERTAQMFNAGSNCSPLALVVEVL